MEDRRRWFSLGFSLRGLALFVAGLSIGLAVGLNYSPFRKMAPNEAFALNLPDYIVEPPDVLSVKVHYPSAREDNVDGDFLVGPDGRLHVDTLRSAYVTGLTLAEIERTLAQMARDPNQELSVSVSVAKYNSKRYFLITDLPFPDHVVTLPFTGKDHVLDVLPHVEIPKPLTDVNIWVSRPHVGGGSEILPVNYEAITVQANPLSNYQLLPGDRLFVSSKPMPKQ